MTWRRRPAVYEVPVIQAAPLSPVFSDDPHAPAGAGLWARFTNASWHRKWERMPLFFTVLGARRGGRGVAVRDHPDVPDQVERPDDRVGQAVHAARAGRPRHLHPRGLLQLPLADDPPVPLRDRALRRVLQARRVGVRPSVPVGIAPHRPRPRARGRQVSRTSGTCGTSTIRARSRRSRSCRRTRTSLPTSSNGRSSRSASTSMAMLGVPYGDAVTRAEAMARTQATEIADDIVTAGGPTGAAGQGDRRAHRVPPATGARHQERDGRTHAVVAPQAAAAAPAGSR